MDKFLDCGEMPGLGKNLLISLTVKNFYFLLAEKVIGQIILTPFRQIF